jgi:hypothetical protein
MKKVPWLIAIVVVVAAVLLVLRTREEAPPPPVAIEAPSAQEPEISATAPPPTVDMAAPSEVSAEPAEPLPPLDESDEAVRDQAVGLFGSQAVGSFLASPAIVRKLVVTVDNLPRDRVAMRLRAVPDMPGRFVASGPEDAVILDEGNFVRYRPFVDLVAAMDAVQVAAVYRRLYPLLQQAYEELGYPGEPFHYRVIACIDDLLEAPEVGAGARLIRPNVLYEFADPGLEARSAGQKMLMRMGPENARIVKAKLREVRAALAAPAGPG